MMSSIVLDLLVQLSLRGQLRELTQNFYLPITQQIFVPLNAKDLHELGDWFPAFELAALLRQAREERNWFNSEKLLWENGQKKEMSLPRAGRVL